MNNLIIGDFHMHNIFIVDDEPNILHLLNEYMKMWGHYIVGKARSGNEALEIIHNLQNLPDVVITDYRMENGDGLFLSQALAKRYPNLKIIMLTGDANITVSKAKENGVHILLKKMHFNCLKDVLNKFIPFQA